MLRSLFFLLGAASWSCATPAPIPIEKPHERIIRERRVGNDLSSQLEVELKIKKAEGIEKFLSELALRLASFDSELKEITIQVVVIDSYQKKWKSFSLPGGRIYLPLGLLKKIEYDNEAAALVAFELSHLKKRNLVKRLEAIESEKQSARTLPNLFGSQGLFTYDDETLSMTSGGAVELLYSAGFDSRGLVSLLKRFEQNEAHSPFEKETLEHMLEQTRLEIAQRTPLRNPIVRTLDFQVFKKQLAKIRD